jgi:hypothetical protein
MKKKIIKKFCKTFGIKVKKGAGFMAYPNEIYYPRHKKNYVSDGFMDLINRHYPDIQNVSEFTWSILHEIGHTQTWGNFSKKAWKKYEKTAPYTYDIEEYYLIPQEKAATDWAADYIRKHPKKIAKFEKKIAPYL